MYLQLVHFVQMDYSRSAFPNTLPVSVTLRDFQDDHPDFESKIYYEPGIVTTYLNGSVPQIKDNGSLV